MEMKMQNEAQRVVLAPVVSVPELMQHVVLTLVPPHPKLGDLITTRVVNARLEPFLYS